MLFSVFQLYSFFIDTIIYYFAAYNLFNYTLKFQNIFLSFSFLLLVQCLCAQQSFVFRQVDVNTGLSDNLVKSISGLPDGRINILTTSVLNIYNGGTFNYFRQNTGSIYRWNHSGDEKQYVDNENRLWIKQSNTLQVLSLKTNQFEPEVEKLLVSYGVRSKLKDIFIDNSKNIWFLTVENSLLYYDVTLKQLVSVFKDSRDYPREIFQVNDICWIISPNGLIKKWNLKTKKMVGEDRSLENKVNPSSHALVVKQSPSGAVWLMHQTEVFYSMPPFKEWKAVSAISGLSNFFTSMDIDHTDRVWVGTSKAQIRVIDAKSHKTSSFVGLQLTAGGTIVNDISSIYIDEDNGVWIGTLFQGVAYYHPSMIKVSLKHTLPSESHITNENVRGFLEEKDGKILVATGNGLFRYNPSNQTMEASYPELRNKYCMTLFEDSKGRVWVPTFHNGFYCIQNNKVVRHYEYSNDIHADPNPNNARNMFEDAAGQLWVSVYGGVGKFDPETGNIDYLFKYHPEIRNIKMNLNFFDIDKNTFAVAGEDLYFYNTVSKKLSFLPFRDQFDRHGAEYNFVHIDRRGLQWLSVDGLKVWDPTNKKLYQITINELRPNQTVSAILEDNKGDLWVSTMNGISKIEVGGDKKELSFKVLNLGRMDGAGAQAGRFNTEAALKSRDGTLYFGGVHGINIFHPDKIFYNQHTHKPLFTGFRIFNTLIRENTPFRDRVILKEDINSADQVELKHDENFISIEFSGLNYANPSRTFFKYKLENYDQDWTEVQADGLGRATYTGLPAGKYNFKVYAANNDKIWGSDYSELVIVVKPAIWLTFWAKLIYALLLLFALVYLVQWYRIRSHKKIEVKRKEEEQKQKERLEQMKTNFFTNISHEFRTPLSLIMTPLDLLRKQIDDDFLKSKLSSIYGHSEDLLTLVNQLLDFRKLEVNGEELRLSYGDLAEFSEVIYDSFKPLAQSRGVTFLFEREESFIYMLFDKDKVKKIINNLLSNALKFTPEGGRVVFSVTKAVGEVKLHVKDNGIGIKQEEISKVFERFHQASIQSENPSGSGIGLYLVKEYTELHNGRVEVVSVFGEGTEFMVSLPLDLDLDNSVENDSVNKVKEGNPDSKKILIVEDNNELRQFLKTQLSDYFLVIDAKDGEEGEKMAIEQEPDLILSDLMMPKIDGASLCRNLKSKVETSHIPFVLLTAKTSEDVKKDVYESGADSYMSKPFVFDLLLTRIQKLIEQQEKRKALFHTTIEVTPESITINSLDEALVQKALLSVEKNIDNPEYNVDDLGTDMGLSRGNLYRKLQSITGKNPSDFIRTIRLKRAAQLLSDSQLNVSEVADMTGFNGLKYFNKHFKEMFGVTPTQYRIKKD